MHAGVLARWVPLRAWLAGYMWVVFVTHVGGQLVSLTNAALELLCCAVQSTFMKLVEAEMVLQDAEKQLGKIRRNIGNDPLWKRFVDLRQKHESSPQQLSDDEWAHLKALASPHLLTVWFNSW